MAFGFDYSRGGDYLPIIKYDARAGRLTRVDRKDGVSVPVDITNAFKALVDLDNLEHGWIAFGDAGPDFQMARLGEPAPAKPSDRHKMGVRLMLKLSGDCGGDVREFATNASVSLRGLDRLHDEFLAKREEGKLPIVRLKETIPVTTGQGSQKSTNWEPSFEIIGWAARPDDLQPTRARENASLKNPAAPPATGATKVGAPKELFGTLGDFG